MAQFGVRKANTKRRICWKSLSSRTLKHIKAWQGTTIITPTVPWFGRLVAGFSARRPAFGHVRLVVKRQAVGQSFPRIVWCSVGVISPMPHTISCVIRRHYRISVTDGVVKWTSLTTHLHFLLAGDDFIIFLYLVLSYAAIRGNVSIAKVGPGHTHTHTHTLVRSVVIETIYLHYLCMRNSYCPSVRHAVYLRNTTVAKKCKHGSYSCWR